MLPKIFIDGEAGTTGLQIHSQLKSRSDIEVISLSSDDRKSDGKRADAINSCDIAILCLPDDAAKQAVNFVENPRVRILDASSAHRVTEGWVYGLPELDDHQSSKIKFASRVSNPGCYPTGAILATKPLLDVGIVPADYPLNIHAISGYSGSGRQLIDQYENKANPDYTTKPFQGYGLKLNHKHVPEMMRYIGLDHRPLFTPSYGRYKQGIVLYVPIHQRLLNGVYDVEHVRQALEDCYSKSKYVNVVSGELCDSVVALEPEYLNGTNNLDIYVFGSPKNDQILLAAVYDNLGKGASGAAMQNLALMLEGFNASGAAT
jgi:N-acetyl-gamma-glutamyl-phosphate reductase